MHSVKFLKHWGKYNPGEVAGFEEKDRDLLERLAIAGVIGPAEETLEAVCDAIAKSNGEQEKVEADQTASDENSASTDAAAASSDQSNPAPRASKKA
ncbi:hypothetical protein VA599_00315 [Chromobacterium sp. TRC.1.1.SA]|uniref:DUF768 domain-containing protein n=1 Tax=Chromobacterium indicum TaxID=3110228 RepID=A0ABV0CGP7_9NEIS